jgi:hypothetical protein
LAALLQPTKKPQRREVREGVDVIDVLSGAVRKWIRAVRETEYIKPGCPWENGYIESFNARLRVELLNGEIF